MATTAVKSSFLRRLMGAAMLDTGTYEEIEADPGATAQAFAVVLMSSAAAGIGALGWGDRTLPVVIFAGLVALLAWAAWALVTFEIGVRLMPQARTESSVIELMRTIGFASSPGILRVVGVLPDTTVAVYAITAVWMLAAMVVALKFLPEDFANHLSLKSLGPAASVPPSTDSIDQARFIPGTMLAGRYRTTPVRPQRARRLQRRRVHALIGCGGIGRSVSSGGSEAWAAGRAQVPARVVRESSGSPGALPPGSARRATGVASQRLSRLRHRRSGRPTLPLGTCSSARSSRSPRTDSTPPSPDARCSVLNS